MPTVLYNGVCTSCFVSSFGICDDCPTQCWPGHFYSQAQLLPNADSSTKLQLPQWWPHPLHHTPFYTLCTCARKHIYCTVVYNHTIRPKLSLVHVSVLTAVSYIYIYGLQDLSQPFACHILFNQTGFTPCLLCVCQWMHGCHKAHLINLLFYPLHLTFVKETMPIVLPYISERELSFQQAICYLGFRRVNILHACTQQKQIGCFR